MQLNLGISAPAVVIALLGGSFAVFANFISFMMIGKINERLPEGERISYFWWGTEVRKKFRHLYPASRLTLLLDLCVILMASCFPLLVWFWVFGGPGK